ncbi:MAG: hypothetical protein R3D65_12335 [Zhengella sp.]|uniref:hypothetical protein n=1 Tax=Zhengella sp. TaxID=2282762 RepID=UPI00352739DD|nr:hypothetical protein [Brucellaceae bacterium]
MGFSLQDLARSGARRANAESLRRRFSGTVAVAVSKPKPAFAQWAFGAINRFVPPEFGANAPLIVFSCQKAFAKRWQNPY